MNLPAAFLDHLAAIFPADALALDERTRRDFARDRSRYAEVPAAVVFPREHAEVEALVRACRAHRVALTARGGGTSSTGASVPAPGGVVACFSRMQRILAIEPADRYAVVEPGVTNQMLQQALAPHGLFWAPDPGSAPWCEIGGNLATNAGGPRALKYGATRDNVLALRAVAGTGESLAAGSATTKNATGYDLARLLVGSEGTLALITAATLKLVPKPAATRSLRIGCRDTAAAMAAVARILAQPVTPARLEFMDHLALGLARAHSPEAGVPEAGALLLVEVDGTADGIGLAQQAVAAAARGAGVDTLEIARDARDDAALWAARKALSFAQQAVTQHKINEDVVVPPSRLAELVAGAQALAERHAVPLVCFGHAGNGNLHVNFLPRDIDEIERAWVALPDLFRLVLALGGTLSGEHGIGLAKRDWLPQALDPGALAMMRAVKTAFDPDGILNPGKVFC